MLSTRCNDSCYRRLLFCIYSHNLWGGIELWLTELAQFLETRGWAVYVGLARGLRFNAPAAFRQVHPRLKTIEFDGRTGTAEGRIRAVERVVRHLRPDVIIPVGLAEVFYAAARIKETGQPVRVVAPIRATSPELMGDIERFAPIIDLCVGNNPLHARFLESRTVFPDGRLRTIINGVTLPVPGMQRQPTGPLRLLFVGRLHVQHKRILDLPPVVEELERRAVRFELTVVGDGEGRESLLECFGNPLKHGSVRFLGYQSPERITQEIYPQHDVLLHLSASEGCPQVVQQAMAHGVVPVCSNFLGIHSLGFLRDEDTCNIFRLGDITGAAAKLGRLYHQPGMLVRMAQAGRQEMRKFAIEKVFETWEQTIGDVLHLPIRKFGQGDRSISEVPLDQGRLARLGLTPGAIDWVRRVSRRFPELPDGWAEWPGTIANLDEQTRSEILADLIRLDEKAHTLGKSASVLN
jgi:glycosyltransferase involved in cell wall biosynthesis